MVELLLEHNADPNQYDISKTTPLHLSARQGNVIILKLLLKYKANVNIQDFSGFTPLMRAITNKHDNIAKIILANNPKIFIKNNNNQNSFDLTLANNFPQLMKILIKDFHYHNINYLNTLKYQAHELKYQKIVHILQEKITLS